MVRRLLSGHIDDGWREDCRLELEQLQVGEGCKGHNEGNSLEWALDLWGDICN